MFTDFPTPMESKSLHDCEIGELVIIQYATVRQLCLVGKDEYDGIGLLCLSSSKEPGIEFLPQQHAKQRCISLGTSWIIEPIYDFRVDDALEEDDMMIGQVYCHKNRLSMGAFSCVNNNRSSNAVKIDLEQIGIAQDWGNDQVAFSSWNLWISSDDRKTANAQPILQYYGIRDRSKIDRTPG